MVFSSLTFLYVFLPICLVLYFIGPSLRYKNIVLVVLSLLFYAWGEPLYVFLMIGSALVNYLAGIVIGRTGKKSIKKATLIISLIFNFGVLVLFKYTGFILENFGIETSFSPALPIGISFYTFQTVSYIVDVYRGEVAYQKKFYKLLLYISLFPQLIAGPIVRYEDVEAEISSRKPSYEDISSGITRFCVGLGKKVLIANQCGDAVSKIFESGIIQTTVLGTWFGVLMFSVQIYFDFSGYSDMAIGLGRIFGFHYKENFNYPYISRSATEFWRRWHISLGSFFRDYVYIPLGGNRRHVLFNLMITWMLTGLWHGASWNFVIWGLMYGILICIEKIIGKFCKKAPLFVYPIQYIYMFFVTVIGWTVFYFTDTSELLSHFSVMFGRTSVPFTDFFVNNLIYDNSLVFLVGLFFCLPLVEKIFKFIKSKLSGFAVFLEIVFNAAILFLSTIMLAGATYNPFLYFRF